MVVLLQNAYDTFKGCMRIICTVKFVPDVDKFSYDYENNTLVRDNVKLILNPDDSCALAFALKIKAVQPDTIVEVVTMGPKAVIPHMEDLLRRNVDRGVIISDPAFAGSDTYVTSKILGKYLSSKSFDCILTGSHSLDGDTSHVPAQVAEILSLPQMSGIITIDEKSFSSLSAVVDVEDELSISTYQISQPAVLSLVRESNYKLPYPDADAFSRSVSHNLTVLDSTSMGFRPHEVGINGSLTTVVKTYKKSFKKRERKTVTTDDAGIEQVFLLLQEKGYL